MNTGIVNTVTIAEEIKNNHSFRTTLDNEQCYRYKDGIYIEAGEQIIKTEAQKILGYASTKHRLSEIVNYIKVSTYTERTEFDKDINVINLNNGLLNIKTMELKPHTPEHLSTVRIPLTYNPKADCPHIKKFFNEIVDSKDIPVLEELFGYCLYRNYLIQKSFMLLGKGSNGKSTLLGLLVLFLDKPNISSVSLQEFAENRFAKALLYGKLANVYADLSPRALNDTGIFKMLTGGDTINAEKKFGGFFTFVNYAKLIFSANELPQTRDETEAFFRRWVIISFPHTFSEETSDKSLISSLTTDEELSGLLNIALNGLQRLLKNGRFSNSKTSLETKEQYVRISDTVEAFTTDRIKGTLEGWVAKDELYNQYESYCITNNSPIKPREAFFKNIREHLNVEDFRPEVDGKRIYALKGISV